MITTKRPAWPTDVEPDHSLAMHVLLRAPSLVAGGRIRAEAWPDTCQVGLRHHARLTPGERDMLATVVRLSDGETVASACDRLADALAGRMWQSETAPPPQAWRQTIVAERPAQSQRATGTRTDTHRTLAKATRSDPKRRSPEKGAKATKRRKKPSARRKTAPGEPLPDPFLCQGADAGLKLSRDNLEASLFGLPLLSITKGRVPAKGAWRIRCRWLLMRGDSNEDVFYIPLKYIGVEYRAILYAAIKQMVICYLSPPEADALHPADSQVKQ